MPSTSGLAKAGAIMLAALVAVTCYGALHPKVVSQAPVAR